MVEDKKDGAGAQEPAADRAAPGYAVSEKRLDAALARIEASIRSLNGRMRSLTRIEAETQRLASDRNRLAAELDRALSRGNRLDEASADVSRRLVATMETVREVLDGEERS